MHITFHLVILHEVLHLIITTLSLLFSSVQVIPPGMDFSNVVVQEDSVEADGELTALASADGASPKPLPAVWSEVSRNFI